MADLPVGTVSWLPCKNGGVGTLDAVFAGIDKGKCPLFVARITVDGQLAPGKASPDRNCAFAAYHGAEKKSNDYEVLQCRGQALWVAAKNGDVPPNALVTGKTGNGEPLYSCRAYHENTVTLGKVHPSNDTAYISYDGREIEIHDYEVLVVEAN